MGNEVRRGRPETSLGRKGRVGNARGRAHLQGKFRGKGGPRGRQTHAPCCGCGGHLAAPRAERHAASGGGHASAARPTARIVTLSLRPPMRRYASHRIMVR